MKLFNILFIVAVFLILTASNCKNNPFTPDFDHAGGVVIGKETCSMDTATDYWLIDLNVDYTATNKFGDTLALNGTVYNHLVKTKQLLSEFKVIGKKVSFDCYFTEGKVATTGCTVTNPITYNLKEMTVKASFEIR